MLHKSLHSITIKKWVLISGGEDINFKHLFKYPIFSFLAPLMRKKLKNAYMNIIYDFNNLDVELLADYVLWQTYLTEFRIDIENKSLDVNLGTDLKIKYQNLEESFKNYVRKYQENNYNFKIKEYSLTEDYEKKFKEVFKITLDSNEHLLKIHELKDIKFYTKDEYLFKCKEYQELKIIIESDIFYEKFIESKIIELEKIEILDEHLVDLYIENKMYDKYQIVRAKLFDMHILNSETNRKSTIIDDMNDINNYIGSSMTVNDPMSVLESNKVIAKRKIESQKRDNKGNN